MTLFVGGVADNSNIEVEKVNGRPREEVRIAHIVQPVFRWMQDSATPQRPNIQVDVYRFCGGEYRYIRTEGS